MKIHDDRSWQITKSTIKVVNVTRLLYSKSSEAKKNVVCLLYTHLEFCASAVWNFFIYFIYLHVFYNASEFYKENN